MFLHTYEFWQFWRKRYLYFVTCYTMQSHLKKKKKKEKKIKRKRNQLSIVKVLNRVQVDCFTIFFSLFFFTKRFYIICQIVGNISLSLVMLVTVHLRKCKPTPLEIRFTFTIAWKKEKKVVLRKLHLNEMEINFHGGDESVSGSAERQTRIKRRAETENRNILRFRYYTHRLKPKYYTGICSHIIVI